MATEVKHMLIRKNFLTYLPKNVSNEYKWLETTAPLVYLSISYNTYVKTATLPIIIKPDNEVYFFTLDGTYAAVH